MKNGTCPKCGGTEIVENAMIYDYTDPGIKRPLGVTVYANPEAWVFKGETSSSLKAWVCGTCGFAEVYVKNPDKLLECHRKQKESV